MKNKIVAGIITGTLTLSTVLAGCGAQNAGAANNEAVSADSDSAEDSSVEDAGAEEEVTEADDKAETEGQGDVRKIQIAFAQAGVPFSYVDEDGNYTGYDIEVLRKADELIPEYEFEFVPSESGEARTGALEGKYQIAITNSFWTQERADNYILPEQFLGASITALIVRKEDADVTTFEQVSDKGYKLAPIQAGDGMLYVVQEYNDNHPDQQVEITIVDKTDSATNYSYLAEGRYDAYIGVYSSYEKTLANEDGELHEAYSDILTASPYIAVKTYTLINKQETDLAEKLEAALKTLYEDGTYAEISTQFYGEDVFAYLPENEDADRVYVNEKKD